MATLSLPLIIGSIYKNLMLYNSRKKSERLALNWREVSGIKKAVGILVVGYWSFLVYLAVVALLNLTAVAVLPLSPIDSSIILTAAAIGLVWLAYFQSVMSSRKLSSKTK